MDEGKLETSERSEEEVAVPSQDAGGVRDCRESEDEGCTGDELGGLYSSSAVE